MAFREPGLAWTSDAHSEIIKNASLREESASPMSTRNDNPMAELLAENRPPKFPRPFLQFGLGTVFWITTATAVAFTIVFRIPTDFADPLILFVSVAMPAVLTTLIIYGRSYQRTFCIGAMFPAVVFLLLIFSGEIHQLRWNLSRVVEFEFQVLVCSFWGSTVLIGAICVGVRKLAERRPPSPPRVESIAPGAITAAAAMTDLLNDKSEVL